MPLSEFGQLALHRRLLDHADPTAFLDAFDVLKADLEQYLHRAFPNQPPQDCEDVIVEVLFNYLEHPSQFDSSKATLIQYLHMAANGDMRNLIARQMRQEKSVPFNIDDFDNADVADTLLVRNIDQDESVEDQVLNALTTNEHLIALVESLPPIDKTLLHLISDGVRDTETFASVLGVAHLPIDEQRREVKRQKDRLLKYLRRHLTDEN